jgi:hypothetical protein
MALLNCPIYTRFKEPVTLIIFRKNSITLKSTTPRQPYNSKTTKITIITINSTHLLTNKRKKPHRKSQQIENLSLFFENIGFLGYGFLFGVWYFRGLKSHEKMSIWEKSIMDFNSPDINL